MGACGACLGTYEEHDVKIRHGEIVETGRGGQQTRKVITLHPIHFNAPERDFAESIESLRLLPKEIQVRITA